MAHRSSHFPQLVVGVGSATIILALASCCAAQNAQGCNTTADCGQNASCTSQQCTCVTSFFSPSGTNTDCRNTSVPDPQCQSFDPQCVFCGSLYNGPCWLSTFLSALSNISTCALSEGHVRMLNRCGTPYLLLDHKCATIHSCSTVGFSYQPVPNTSLYAKTCLSSKSNGSPLAEWAIILTTVLCVVFLLILGTILVIICLYYYRTYNAQSFLIRQSTPALLPSIHQQTTKDIPLQPTATASRGLPPVDALDDINIMTSPDDNEEAIFLEKLDAIRHQATAFLDILNDIRKKTSKLPSESATAMHYKSVCQDLMRLLYLLNKKPKAVVMPPDGVQLLVWAEHVVEKYPKIHRPQQSNRLSRIGEVDETDF